MRRGRETAAEPALGFGLTCRALLLESSWWPQERDTSGGSGDESVAVLLAPGVLCRPWLGDGCSHLLISVECMHSAGASVETESQCDCILGSQVGALSCAIQGWR